jgi:hypothetical protein
MVRGGLSRDEARQNRLLREAQAMARLTHPNVVAIYDLVVAGGRLFLAMEYVDGITLEAWLAARARPVREILRAFEQCGRGLAAAHAMGLVHRDFKPTNALCAADGGRVCVTDFGLVRLAGTRDEPDAPEVHVSGESEDEGASGSATRSGALLGTLAYMAPEQLRRLASDARADQWAFCVALYEALYAQRPFAGSTVDELLEAMTRGEPRAPAVRSSVPSHVRMALARGLTVDPDRRFSSMDALLEELSHDPRRRRLTIGAVAALGLAVLGGGLVVRHQRLAREGERALVCAHGEASLAGVWDEARRDAVSRAASAAGDRFSQNTGALIEQSLDRYARQWTDERAQSCAAAPAQVGAEADAVAVASDARMLCLDDRLRELRAAVELTQQVSDAAGAATALVAVQSLKPAASCQHARASALLSARPPQRAAEV